MQEHCELKIETFKNIIFSVVTSKAIICTVYIEQVQYEAEL